MSVITNYPKMSHLDMLSTSLNTSGLEDSLEIPCGNKSYTELNNTEYDLEQIRKVDCCFLLIACILSRLRGCTLIILVTMLKDLLIIVRFNTEYSYNAA